MAHESSPPPTTLDLLAAREAARQYEELRRTGHSEGESWAVATAIFGAAHQNWAADMVQREMRRLIKPLAALQATRREERVERCGTGQPDRKLLPRPLLLRLAKPALPDEMAEAESGEDPLRAMVPLYSPGWRDRLRPFG
ncbi:hypothetical protein ACX4MY_20070 [Roseomonas mucosa]|uniref:hypothetical protein n=1 Tax=Roseomonas TaxID=125216 RepID=UPI0011C02ECA|nr:MULTISPECIES: hypothetical protein [Roseomonas]MBS5904729.1 hypothetical protein [Acetobacteraceae bacterium]MCG7350292.1 hypothetical protein [Roseomonas mucosa]MCG7355964.1 hypothetical protein [Roseomonas mucosa]MDT8291472.1 hypothetical protein [Roseomonas mucosa]MDT8292827.1 hypothetical protein [Roseomonas mucosa]